MDIIHLLSNTKHESRNGQGAGTNYKGNSKT